MDGKRRKGVIFWVVLAGVVGLAVAGQNAMAQQPAAQPNDSTVSARVVTTDEVNAIAHKLMAPCCWSETADIHQSSAAAEMRDQIRKALEAGYSESEILAAFEKVYGERILARPKAQGFNLLVWTLPPAVLVVSLVFAARFLRKSESSPQAPSPRKKKKRTQVADGYEARIEEELRSLED